MVWQRGKEGRGAAGKRMVLNRGLSETTDISPCMNQNILDQEWTAISLLRFAFSTIVMMIFMGLYTIVDTIFVAQLVSTDALSAINIACPIINFTVGLGTMVATGGNALVSRKMGAGACQEAREDFTLSVIFGLPIGVALVWQDFFDGGNYCFSGRQ